ncbi:peptidase C14 caspase catalytic subunit p20 [Xanthobacter versatilis]|uniref:Peptidase C14 caspase catalytic subunit p20 n=1 Tax=Xanthobacter autotrophicus (strain ATCC BAA-1158 / Py2) TaxID=78245 RepID=A7ID81_XANP2|nr:peptidase C14 caspase catalytic subunit p20 [Xanthobacter autotrophicus Py2]MCB1359236.1 caspase family protein [Maritimibacter sp.]
MRKALVVGINHYDKAGSLYGCVSDAYSVNAMLERDADGSRNFHTRILTATGPGQEVNRAELRGAIQELFNGDSEIALLYFAGHGYVEAAGGFLCPSDTETGDDGVSLADVMTWANKSAARNKVIILDSCHSGVVGKNPIAPVTELSEGMTILTASTEEQYANEQNGSGVFTTLLVDALGGAAANLVGEVTPGSVYAHIDQSLGAWAQRPVFKTNVKTFVSLRKVQPPLELGDLRRLAEFFPEPGFEYPLDPSYEPHRSGNEKAGVPGPDSEKTVIFAILQKYNRVNLVVPVGAPHMWHAAMESKACTLTALGEHYRRLVANGMI